MIIVTRDGVIYVVCVFFLTMMIRPELDALKEEGNETRKREYYYFSMTLLLRTQFDTKTHATFSFFIVVLLVFGFTLPWCCCCCCSSSSSSVDAGASDDDDAETT